MATVSFDSMIGELSMHVSGCPTAVMDAMVRKIATDLCERAKVWRITLPYITLTAGVADFVLASNVSDTEISTIIDGNLYLSDLPKTTDIIYTTAEKVYKNYPQWPDTVNPSQPLYMFSTAENHVNVHPVPDTAHTYKLQLQVAIRPTITAAGWDSTLANQYKRVIFHGVLHELMLMPNKSWTDEKTSLYHGKQWAYLVNQARARANKSFGRANIHVQMVGW
jgi:hypothetical protein